MPTFTDTGEGGVTYQPRHTAFREHLPGYLTVAAGVIIGLLLGHLAVRYDRPGLVALMCWIGLWCVVIGPDIVDTLRGRRPPG